MKTSPRYDVAFNHWILTFDGMHCHGHVRSDIFIFIVIRGLVFATPFFAHCSVELANMDYYMLGYFPYGISPTLQIYGNIPIGA